MILLLDFHNRWLIWILFKSLIKLTSLSAMRIGNAFFVCFVFVLFTNGYHRLHEVTYHDQEKTQE